MILGNSFKLGRSGKGSNQAVAAARLDADVSLITKIGNDAFGEMAKRFYVEQGIAEMLYASRLASGIPTAGDGRELDAIVAAVVGGASLTGGEGTILGTVLCALVIATLRNGGDFLGNQSLHSEDRDRSTNGRGCFDRPVQQTQEWLNLFKDHYLCQNQKSAC